MSPQELINNLGALQRRGAFDNRDLKALIEQKLEQAKTAARVSAFKAEEAMKAADLSADVRKQAGGGRRHAGQGQGPDQPADGSA